MSSTVSPLAPRISRTCRRSPACASPRPRPASGIKDRTDVLLALFDKGTTVAGVFTRSKCPSAPVDWCRAALKARHGARARRQFRQRQCVHRQERPRGDGKLTADIAAQGDRLQAGGGLPRLDRRDRRAARRQQIRGVMDGARRRRRSPGSWLEAAAKAIMTTDTYPKVATATAKLGKATVTINGIAKGAGMIAPDMATMLAFVFTDAPIAAPALQATARRGVTDSFNAITVDGDTSTSDTLLVFATGAAAERGAPAITRASDPRLRHFATALDARARESRPTGRARRRGCAEIRRGHRRGRGSPKSARRIALSIANSPLVKTAIAGEDANWGRVVMAVGKAGEPADRDRLAIWFGDIRVAHKGERDPDLRRGRVSADMKKPEIRHGRARASDAAATAC